MKKGPGPGRKKKKPETSESEEEEEEEEVNHTASSLLVILKHSCSKLHCIV